MSRGRAAVAITAIVAAVGFLSSLGLWQLRRLEWKETLIAHIEQRSTEQPAPLPPSSQWATLDADAYDFRRVRTSGRFDDAHSGLVYALPPPGAGSEPGYDLLTPLLLEDGSAVVVDRGFLTQSRARAAMSRLTSEAPAPADAIEIVGVMRAPQGRNAFTPADQPSERIWYARDPAPIAAALGLRRAAPFAVVAEAASRAGNEEVIVRPTSVGELPNNHLAYAVTWFGLAAALLLVAFLYGRDVYLRSRR